MNTQRIGSIVRQVLAVLVTVYGVLTACIASLHLPPSVSTILVAAGPIMLAIEHYVSDPSTGTPAVVAAPGPQAVPQAVPSAPLP